MRRALDLLYKGSGFLAGFFLVAIAVLSAAQIAARELGFAAYSYDDFAGFCLAASSFLGLAYTFRENEHIRMTLLLHHERGVLSNWSAWPWPRSSSVTLGGTPAT